MNAVTILSKFLYQSDEDMQTSLHMIHKIETKLFNSKLHSKQSKITDYFK